jgi:hypothetical protein
LYKKEEADRAGWEKEKEIPDRAALAFFIVFIVLVSGEDSREACL